MKTRSALRVAAIILIGLVTLGQPIASADKVDEFYGTGFRVTSMTITRNENLSDCDDTLDNTNVVLQTNIGKVEYTGVMEGSGEYIAKVIVDGCVPGHTHTTFRAVDTFDNRIVFENGTVATRLTVDGRKGRAVVEFVGNGRIVPIPQGTATLNETRIRILCGTGGLKRLHAEGTLTASIRRGPEGQVEAQSRAMQIWAHFGHNHDVGFNFLCEDLEGNNPQRDSGGARDQ